MHSIHKAVTNPVLASCAQASAKAKCMTSPLGGGGIGHDNCIDTSVSPGSDVVGSFIAGGGNNNIFNSSCYSSVGGGQGNTVVAGACYSSVIGGQGNTVVHNWATVAGFNVTSQADCAFTTNCLVACNTPAFSIGAFAPGTLQFVVAPAILGFPAGTCMVLIQ